MPDPHRTPGARAGVRVHSLVLACAALLGARDVCVEAQLHFYRFNMDGSTWASNCTDTGKPADAQLTWSFEPLQVGMKTGMLIENTTGRCLTVMDCAATPSAQLMLQACKSGCTAKTPTAQQWQLDAVDANNAPDGRLHSMLEASSGVVRKRCMTVVKGSGSMLVFPCHVVPTGQDSNQMATWDTVSKEIKLGVSVTVPPSKCGSLTGSKPCCLSGAVPGACWGCYFIIVAAASIVAYLGLGFAYNSITNKKHKIPNAKFWKEVGRLIRDGVYMIRSKAGKETYVKIKDPEEEKRLKKEAEKLKKAAEKLTKATAKAEGKLDDQRKKLEADKDKLKAKIKKEKKAVKSAQKDAKKMEEKIKSASAEDKKKLQQEHKEMLKNLELQKKGIMQMKNTSAAGGERWVKLTSDKAKELGV